MVATGVQFLEVTTHRVSSHDCKPSARLSLALCMFREKYDLNLNMHL
jgi:hypothetical protein